MIRVFILILTVGLLSCSTHKLTRHPKGIKNFLRLENGVSVYYAKYETSNGEYNKFLANLALEDSSEWKRCTYDSTKWTGISPKANLAISRSYHSHPAYSYYPVVNITVYGARKYCNWLNELSNNPGVVYRLPTLDEQKIMISQIDTLAISTFMPSPDRDKYFANLKYTISGTQEYGVDGATFSAPVRTFFQNKQRAASIIGNVSEMNSNGSRIGGGWNELPPQALQPQTLLHADPNVGFRVFLDVVD